ncbi:MAG: hypothetical protein JNL08_16555 [Planctomycetes bacterium]|nr:hypothetical protein [Planctomycetota bacterium]
MLWTPAVFGFALSLVGIAEHRRALAFAAEVQRARAEWPELADRIRALRRDGGNVARFLQDRGYREFGVRRWITAELDPGQPPRQRAAT